MAISREVFMDWYFRRQAALEEEARKIIEAIRKNREAAQPAACERLRMVEVQRQTLARVYEDLKGFILD
jgi:hypothetical protein